MTACIISICFIGGQAIAGNNYQNRGTGIFVDICAAPQIIISGTISDADLSSGQGIQVDTGSELVTIYGIGPIRFWDSLDVARPTIGDNVTIDAREVTFSDVSTKIIAISITFNFIDSDDDITIELRDEGNYCLPNWRGGNSANNMLNSSSLDKKNTIHVAGKGNGSSRGPGNGTGNGGSGPKDGSGNGSRTGDCPFTT